MDGRNVKLCVCLMDKLKQNANALSSTANSLFCCIKIVTKDKQKMNSIAVDVDTLYLRRRYIPGQSKRIFSWPLPEGLVSMIVTGSPLPCPVHIPIGMGPELGRIYYCRYVSSSTIFLFLLPFGKVPLGTLCLSEYFIDFTDLSSSMVYNEWL